MWKDEAIHLFELDEIVTERGWNGYLRNRWIPIGSNRKQRVIEREQGNKYLWKEELKACYFT